MLLRQVFKKIGSCVATVVAKSLLDRFRLGPRDEVIAAEASDELLITPFDADFATVMVAYERGAKKYRNALRQLGR